MTNDLPSTNADLQDLRALLKVRARAGGVPAHEVDDVVDRALAKAAREPVREGAPPFAVRAGAALRDERVEFFRRGNARPQLQDDAEPPDIASPDTAHARLEFAELVRELRAELGDETLEYAFLVSAGYSEREIAERPGWDTLRAGRVRRRLKRRGPAVVAKLNQLARHKEAS